MFSTWQHPGSLPTNPSLGIASQGSLGGAQPWPPPTHPSSPWSQPLMTWPVPREKTKGWFWGRLLSNSVPSSNFPCRTMGRPVRRVALTTLPSTPQPYLIALAAIVLRGQTLRRLTVHCWCQPREYTVKRVEPWKLA